MTLNDYQQHALTTVIAKNKKDDLMHWVLGLSGEAGEVADKFKKWIRDNDSDITQLDIDDLTKELGDVLWYVAVLAHELDIDLDTVGTTNLEKLRSRKARGVLGGSGDNR